MRSFVLACITMIAGWTSAFAAPARPDLGGTWEMDMARTRMWKKAVRPVYRVDEVRHGQDTLHWSWSAEEPKGPIRASMRFALDGGWTHNHVAGHKCRSRVSWNADTMVVDSHGRFLLLGWHLQDRIHLAADGRELRATRRFRMARMDETEQWVFQRVGEAQSRETPARAMGALERGGR